VCVSAPRVKGRLRTEALRSRVYLNDFTSYSISGRLTGQR
jgi:hypothetical protein